MGIHRRYANRPFGDLPATEPAQVERTTQSRRETSSDSWSNPTASCTRRRRCEKSTNRSFEDADERIRVTRPPEPENTTRVTETLSRCPENVSIAPNVGSSSNRLAVTRRTRCDSSTAIVDDRVNKSSTPNQLNRFSQNLAYERRSERDRLPNTVDSTSSNNSAIRRRQPLKDASVNTKPLNADQNNTSLPPDRLNGSSADRDIGRSPECGRTLDEIDHRPRGSVATDRKSVASRETASESAGRSSQTGEVDAERRRGSGRHDVYWRYADVLITNADNLEHTIGVQQVLFRQQLDDDGEHRAPAETGTPPPPRTDAAMEWVVKRRADGSRYITRRPARWPPGWRAERRRTAEERRRRRRIETTTDDGASELKTGRYWSRDERRKQVRDDMIRYDTSSLI